MGVVVSGRGEMTEQDGVSKEVEWNGKEAGLEEESEEEGDDSAGEDDGRTGYSLLSQGTSSDDEDTATYCSNVQDPHQLEATTPTDSSQPVATSPTDSQPVVNDIRISKTTCCSCFRKNVIIVNVILLLVCSY